MASRVTGINEFKRTLKGLKKKIEKVAKAAAKEGAKVITNEAKREAPVDTGLLRRSIKTRAIKRSRRKVGYQTIIGANSFNGAFYASFQEFGTRYIKAREYLKKAVESKGSDVLDRMTREISKGIQAIRG